ncbi:MAG: flagellin [Vampirovibrionales bacterium]|nr:flagellin [Vampirovibrionales bacterium]
MPSILNTNIASLIAQYQLGFNSKQVEKSMERLSSGYRINHAADDAAGLAISHNLTSQVGRLNQALRNTQDGISVLQVADGSLQTINDSLQRVRELTIQAANDSYSTALRDSIEGEIMSLMRDIDRVANSSQFNGINLLDGTATNAVIQFGIGSDVNSYLNINTALSAAGTGDAAGPGGLAIVGGTATFADIADIGVTGLNPTTASTFLTDIDNALRAVNDQRGRIGAFHNQFENVSQNIMQSVENLSSANSRIRDVDVASETSTLAQYQVLQNASVSILGQTNNLPQMILGLLQNRG